MDFWVVKQATQFFGKVQRPEPNSQRRATQVATR